MNIAQILFLRLINMENRCPICGFNSTDEILCISNIPVAINTLYRTRKDALKANKSHINLRFCKRCLYIYNSSFNNNLIDYTMAY